MKENLRYSDFADRARNLVSALVTHLEHYLSVALEFVKTKAVPGLRKLLEAFRRLPPKQQGWIEGGAATLILFLLIVGIRHKHSAAPASTSQAVVKSGISSPAKQPLKLAVQTSPSSQAAPALQAPVFKSSAAAVPQGQQTDNSETVDISTSKDVSQQDDNSADQTQAQTQEAPKQAPVEPAKPAPSNGNDASNGDVPPPQETNGDPGAGNGDGSTSGG